MESIWEKTAQLPDYTPLSGDLSADAVVIGGGMAGLLTAFFLRQRGVDAVVLEADQVASGQTAGTTAKITSQHGLIYARLAESLGEKAAQEYAHANAQAIQDYKDIARQLAIDCHMEEKDAYLYSCVETDALQREAEAAAHLGLAADFTTQPGLPFAVKGALRFTGQAQFHPLLFLQGILPALRIFAHTKILRVEGGHVETDRGTVEAKSVIFACHYPFPNVPGYFFLRMHQERSYVLALENAGYVEGMYLGVDAGSGWSIREAEGKVLLGGANHRTGENRGGGRYAALRKAAQEFWPDCTVWAQWSAQDCMTLDGVPYIGRFSEDTPDWYVATGFNKWGMTSSMAAARLLSDMIVDGASPYESVFSPQRFTPAASAKAFFSDGAHAVRDLTRRVFAPPRADTEALPPGHGGVVEVDGEKAGVYKDEDGEIHVVSIKCPHLGCQLEWNPDEKSWDCPCHGSRFSYTGKRISGPAQEDLCDG